MGKQILSRLLPWLTLVIFLLLLGYRIIFFGEVLFTGDNFDLIFPQRSFWLTEMRNGSVPLWNPYILSGTPYLADINLGTFAPTNLLYLFINPIEKAGSVIFLIDLFLLGAGVMLLNYYYKRSTVAATISAITLTSSAITAAYITNLSILNTFALLPLTLAVLLFALRGKKMYLFLLSVLIYTLQIISGHPQITYYSGLLAAVFILTSNNPFLKKLTLILAFFVFSLSLAGVQILPFIELIPHTVRFNQSFAWVTQGSLRIVDLAKFVIPKFVANFFLWTDFSLKLNPGYIGVIPFIFLCLAFVFAARGEYRIWKIILIVSVLLALGKSTPFYYLVYYLIPGFASLKVPSQALAVYSLSASVLVAAGVDLFLGRKVKIPFLLDKKFLRLLSLGTGLLLLFLIFVFYRMNLIQQAPQVSDVLVFKYYLWGANGIFTLLLTAVFCISCYLYWHRYPLLAQILLFSFILFDSFFSFHSVLITAPVQSITHSSNISQIVKDLAFRIYTLPAVYKPPSPFFPREIEKIIAREKSFSLLPNQNIYSQIKALDGYSSMAIAKYLEQYTDPSLTTTGLGKLDVSKIDFSNTAVNYVIVSGKQNFTHPAVKKVISLENNSLYKIDSAPRFYLSKGGTIRIIKEEPTHLIFETRSSANGKFIFLDTFYPGWSATIDSRPVSIERFNSVYRQVDLPSGVHRLEFIFNPKSYREGVLTTIAASFLFVILFAVSVARKTYV